MTLLIIIRIIYEKYFRFPHFKILKAGMQKWRFKKSEELISYQIELKTKKSSTELVFEELWINEKKYKFHLRRGNRKIAGSFSEKEILILNVISGILIENKVHIPTIASKGIMLLGYSFRNKRKYLRVKKFNIIENIRLSGCSQLIS